MKKVLMIGYCNKFFRKEFASNIGDENCVFDILSLEAPEKESEKFYNKIFSCDNKFSGKIHTVLVYIKMLIILLFLKKYDAIHIHSVKKIESVYARLLRKKCKRLVCTIYGSDFYRINDFEKKKLSKLFENSDYITIETSKTISDFNDFYNNAFSDKIVNIRFGIASLEEMQKLQRDDQHVRKLKINFEIPQNSFVITVGYNATKEQHHLDILDQLKKIENILPDNYYIVIPLGYGDLNYGRRVAEYLKETGLKGICLFDFYTNDIIAQLRMISNIMIQLQDTDSLSSSMLEYLYADNIIVTGAWLPYKEIEKYIVQIDSIDVLDTYMEDIIDNWKNKIECLKDTDYIDFLEKNFIWRNVKKAWVKLYVS